MSKQKLLIIDKHQFGYLTDVYQWCRYLSSEYEITVVSADTGEKRISLPGVKVHMVNFRFPRIIRAILFILTSIYYISCFKGAIIVEYFQGCSILKHIFPHKKMMADVRTLSVSPDEDHRKSYNNRMRKDLMAFDSISAISKGVIKQIELENIHLLPLGADPISTKGKSYIREMNLLYVGTLRWRNIEQTIKGLKIFISKHPDITITYNVIGSGEPGQVEELRELVHELNLENIIIVHGQIPYTALGTFFDNSNIGISYVPITSYYDYQPPTKTFEYILSGLFCIATATSSNKGLITPENGLLSNDTPDGFAKSLEQFLNIRDKINEKELRKSLSEYTWHNIVLRRLTSILNKVFL